MAVRTYDVIGTHFNCLHPPSIGEVKGQKPSRMRVLVESATYVSDRNVEERPVCASVADQADRFCSFDEVFAGTTRWR